MRMDFPEPGSSFRILYTGRVLIEYKEDGGNK